jgi:hypothetical protein
LGVGGVDTKNTGEYAGIRKRNLNWRGQQKVNFVVGVKNLSSSL